ncbi:MAG: hypothetical protein R6X15_04140 [Pseudomonadota bacterium]
MKYHGRDYTIAKQANPVKNDGTAWLDRLDIGVELVWYSIRRLWREGALQQAGSLKLQSGGGAAYWLASPEQAMLEVL